MKKEGVLSNATRTPVESSARLSQETINSHVTLVLAILDQLVLIFGNCDGEEVSDTWVEDLSAEKGSQVRYGSRDSGLAGGWD